jgi:hypothetical protein
MMRPRDIRPLRAGVYEVTVEGPAGERVAIVCTLIAHPVAPAVSMNPDLVMAREPPRVDGREIAKFVLDFHRRFAASSPDVDR